MKTLKPIPLKDADFTPYGVYSDLKNCPGQTHGNLTVFQSEDKIITRPLKLGMTVSDGGDFTCRQMERHKTTEEVLFSGSDTLLLAIATSSPDGSPKTEDIRVFLMEPGELVILNRGIWHDACHSPNGSCHYYFMAHNDGSADETVWYPVEPEAVCINAEMFNKKKGE